MILNYKYFTVEPLPKEAHRKTQDWNVLNNKSGTPIGRIRWYGPWRQYCFFPLGDSVWSAGCLEDVQTAIRAITEWAR
jgi:hypothetical protein